MKHLKIGRDKPVSKCMNLDYTMQLTDQASAENATQTKLLPGGCQTQGGGGGGGENFTALTKNGT